MYLLDSNVLIEAKNRYYAFEIAPGFWEWLDHAHAAGIACSIETVQDELLKGNDELAKWAKLHSKFFRALDQETTRHFPKLTEWAHSGGFTDAALAAFTDSTANYLLIAYAKEHGHVLVTQERPAPKAKTRVLIPNACDALHVKYVDTFTMLRETGAQLDLRL